MVELSVHLERLETPITPIIKNSKLEWVYIVNPPAENPFPGKKVVGRFVLDEEQSLIAQGALGAARWWELNAERVAQARYLYAIVVCNEPVGDWPVVNEYMKAWQDICKLSFPYLKTVVGNFSAGCPEPEEARFFASSIKEADYIGFHEYWVPEHWEKATIWAGWLMGRYKKFMNHLPPSLRDKKILITETGCDGLTLETLGKPNKEEGWKKFYSSPQAYLVDLTKYKNLLDLRVQAAFVFGGGPWPRWTSYEVTPELMEGILALNEEVEMQNPIRIKKPDGTIEVMELEEYLAGVLPKEIYPTWPPAILEAQAIAARTYALAMRGRHQDEGFDLCSTSHCQNYSDKRVPSCTLAVEATKGIVGIHKQTGLVVPTYYSASCGGHTKGDWGDYLKEWTNCPCAQYGKPVKGHQNGLCQWGGKALADYGKNWMEILDSYYDLRWVGDYGRGEEIVMEPSESLNERLTNLEKEVQLLKEAYSQLKLIKTTLVVYGEEG